MARLILVLSGLSFAGFGAAFLARPAEMAAVVSLTATAPTAVTEIRAIYGGLEIGIGLFLLTAASRRSSIALGLRASALMFGGFAAGRAAGLVLDGFAQPTTWWLGGFEAAAAILSVWALRWATPSSSP